MKTRRSVSIPAGWRLPAARVALIAGRRSAHSVPASYHPVAESPDRFNRAFQTDQRQTLSQTAHVNCQRVLSLLDHWALARPQAADQLSSADGSGARGDQHHEEAQLGATEGHAMLAAFDRGVRPIAL